MNEKQLVACEMLDINSPAICDHAMPVRNGIWYMCENDNKCGFQRGCDVLPQFGETSDKIISKLIGEELKGESNETV